VAKISPLTVAISSELGSISSRPILDSRPLDEMGDFFGIVMGLEFIAFSHLQFSQIRGRQPYSIVRKKSYVIPRPPPRASYPARASAPRHGGRDARGKCGRERLAQREPRRIVLGIDPLGDRGEGKTAAAQCAAQLCGHPGARGWPSLPADAALEPSRRFAIKRARRPCERTQRRIEIDEGGSGPACGISPCGHGRSVTPELRRPFAALQKSLRSK
jgi:hypothetical protein